MTHTPSPQPLMALAKVKARPSQRASLLSALAALVEPSRAEQGCSDYTLFELHDEPGTFYVRETWADQEALDFHMATPHFRAFAARFDELLEEPIRLTRLNAVPGARPSHT
ncbi:putative quinol monooxygenase [Streptomyces sp. SP18CS02]|uniref:putative quinol monooxygenase n=1 Tax=Streptomyces sp. SP18CS02 TaxID=3002531 RepID=UPI002E78F236|nr:putative quinol monooxygenase [Streptomyces sp. SP18CS02]MEE1754475.1 putative quinol monooxygenase [Streptomyces sp. SP18CS02]